ncbi:MAG TPA: response regulator [Pyrinomonadaceae bacterium]
MNKARNSRATVLVVEDIDWIRAGMKRSLRLYDYLVLEASNDEEAIEIASGRHLDLILMEEALPTFAALALRLREHPTLCHVPVVIVNPDMEEGIHYGDINVLPDYDRIGHLLAALRSQS